jgi:hypothetical protein
MLLSDEVKFDPAPFHFLSKRYILAVNVNIAYNKGRVNDEIRMEEARKGILLAKGKT